MKTVTIDFNEYNEELRAEFRKGFCEALNYSRRIVLETLAGANEETLSDICDQDELLLQFVTEVFPNLKAAIRTYKIGGSK